MKIVHEDILHYVTQLIALALQREMFFVSLGMIVDTCRPVLGKNIIQFSGSG